MTRRLLALSLILAAAFAPSVSRADHAGPNVAGICEGYGPKDRHCELTFVAEREVVSVSFTQGWKVGVLRGSISDGTNSMEIRCDVECRGTGNILPIPAGATVTIEVRALVVGGSGYWALAALYDAAP